MRRFFRMLLLTLVLMTVALISALTAMRLAIHGREVTIPKLVGMSPSEAERVGAASGLLVVIEREFYSADIPDGHRHLRTRVTFADGSAITFQEATMAALVRAYVAVKTDP